MAADLGLLVNDAIGASQPVQPGMTPWDWRPGSALASAGWRFVPPGTDPGGAFRIIPSAPAPAPVTVAPLPMTVAAVVQEQPITFELMSMPVLKAQPVSTAFVTGEPVIKAVTVVTPPLAITPLPAPLPSPSESWLDRAARTVQGATAGFDAGKEQGKRLAEQINALPGAIGREIESTRSDVAQAATLNKTLPLAVAAVGVFMGFPIIGIAAGAFLWSRGQSS